MLAIEGICVPRFFLGRSSLPGERGGVFLRSHAENAWDYLSLSPNSYTLEDFWEESSVLLSRLDDLTEEPGE
jgi:hypothetical protein